MFFDLLQWWKIYTNEDNLCHPWMPYILFNQPKKSTGVHFSIIYFGFGIIVIVRLQKVVK